MKVSTPIAVADAEPTAVQQISTLRVQPLNAAQERRRRSSSLANRTRLRHSAETPGSRNSSGIIVEERNLSDSESDAGEGALQSKPKHNESEEA